MAHFGSEVAAAADGSLWANKAAAPSTEAQVTEGRQWPWEPDENSERKYARLVWLYLRALLMLSLSLFRTLP